MATPSSHALFLVDGYNIIGAWTSLKRVRDKHGLEIARQELIEKLINYTAYQGYQTQVVFDSQYQNTPSSHEHYTPELSVYYTAFAQTADTYIEKICASFYRRSEAFPDRVIVATSDRAQRLTVKGYGAECISAQRLETDIESAEKQSRRKQRPQKQSQGRFLFHSLDPNVQQALTQWQKGSSSRKHH